MHDLVCVAPRTIVATVVNLLAELPFFYNWRCHARRLEWPFRVITRNVEIYALLQKAVDFNLGESAHLMTHVVGRREGHLGLLLALLQALPYGVSVLFVQVDVVLLQPFCKAIASGMGADLMFWHIPRMDAGFDSTREVGSNPEYALRSLMVGGGSVLLLRNTNAMQEVLAGAVSASRMCNLGLGSLVDEGCAFYDAIRWRCDAGIMCFHLPQPGESPSCMLLVQPLERLGVVMNQHGGPFSAEDNEPPYVVSYWSGSSSVRDKMRAMWQNGHWALSGRHGFDGAPFAGFFGVWDISYSSGLKLVYNISRAGEVHAVGKTDGSAVGWLREKDARPFTHDLEGVFAAGKWERLRLSSRGLELQHWIGTDMICTASGKRRGGFPGRAAKRIPSCGCPSGAIWSRARLACSTEPDLGRSLRHHGNIQQRFTGRPLLQEMLHILRQQQDCQRPVVRVRLGRGGGFASKFQMATAKATAALRRGMRFQFVGHFGWYTNNSACLQLLGLDKFTQTGYDCYFAPEARAKKSCPPGQPKATHIHRVPTLAVVQATLLRPNIYSNRIYERFANNLGYDAARPLIGLHIRRGDKTTNIYNRYHPAAAYVNEALHAAAQLSLCRRSSDPCQIYVASDSAETLYEVQQSVKSSGAPYFLQVLALPNSATQAKSAVGVELAQDEMLKGFDAYRLALEVLFDIEMLSRAQILVGTLASQVTRVAAVVGVTYGTMMHTIALDFHLLAEMRSLFSQWGIRVDDVQWQTPQFLQ